MIARSIPAFTLMLAGAAALSGCASIRTHQGYVLDGVLADSIQPGVDNRDSVVGTLGRPTFAGQFDNRDWYYITRNSKQLAFQQPKPVTQQVLHIRFDDAGRVASVERTGVEQVASISPTSDKTPTLGRKRGFFQDLFGNIGRVGAPVGGAGPSGNTGGGG